MRVRRGALPRKGRAGANGRVPLHLLPTSDRSAFRIVVYFRQDDVEITRGTLKAYEHRPDESNRWLRTEFCTNCGTTVSWTLELLPGARGIAGGTFDDPAWLKIERHSWTRSAHPWVIVPPDVERFPKGALQQPLRIK